MTYDVIIIGAGTGGLFAAACHTRKVNGLIIDQSKTAGKKLLLSGGGGCNITHDGSIKDFINHYGDQGERLRSVLYKYSNLSLSEYFEGRNVPLVTREDGKLFPKSLNAKDILNALLTDARSNGFQLLMNTKVTALKAQGGSDLPINPALTLDGETSGATCTPLYEILCDDEHFLCRKLIIATGGRSYPTTGSDGSMMPLLASLGLEIIPQRPALTPVSVDLYPYKELSGISFSDIQLTIAPREKAKGIDKSKAKTFTGDLLFTHTGLSGPVILNASRYISQGDRISINYFPGKDKSALLRDLKAFASGNGKQTETALFNYTVKNKKFIPKRFIELLLQRLGLNGEVKVSSLCGMDLDRILTLLTCDTFTVSGLSGYHMAMVTAGGVALNEIDLKTMECKKYPRMHIIGEALDVDGDTGGYNIQFAFSSGNAAAKA